MVVMYYLHPVTILLLWTFASGIISTDVTYEDLKEIDGECTGLDSCRDSRTEDTLAKYTCHCSSFCSKFRTCCMDSTYRDIKSPGRRPTCRPGNDDTNHYYFMVDTCSSRNTDEEMEKECKEDPIEQDNLTPMIPVTSLSTNVTYKNYYCFKCNEAKGNYVSWSVKVKAARGAEDVEALKVVLTYDTIGKTWTAPVGAMGDSIPVTLFMEVPSEIKTLPKVCVPNVTSTCAGEWRDGDVRRKCSKYTSIIYIPINNEENIPYMNPHCALCNFQSLDRMGCYMGLPRFDGKSRFSFSLLLDFNTSDGGNEVGKIQRCDKKSTWDPKFKKCRRYTCAIPGHVIKNGKCQRP